MTFFSKLYRNFARPAAIALLLALSVTGCKYRYIDEPERLLTPDEMSDVICQLAYLSVLEEQGLFDSDSTLSRIGKDAFIERLYEQYDINRDILRQNNEYYSEYNRQYVKIYAQALNKLSYLAGEEEKKEKDNPMTATGWGSYQ